MAPQAPQGLCKHPGSWFGEMTQARSSVNQCQGTHTCAVRAGAGSVEHGHKGSRDPARTLAWTPGKHAPPQRDATAQG